MRWRVGVNEAQLFRLLSSHVQFMERAVLQLGSRWFQKPSPLLLHPLCTVFLTTKWSAAGWKHNLRVCKQQRQHLLEECDLLNCVLLHQDRTSSSWSLAQYIIAGRAPFSYCVFPHMPCLCFKVCSSIKGPASADAFTWESISLC